MHKNSLKQMSSFMGKKMKQNLFLFNVNWVTFD